MSPRAVKSLLLLAAVLVSAVAFLAWAMPWFSITVVGDAAAAALSVGADRAAPAISALSLASLASVAALSIAGRVFRLVLAIIEAVIGATIVIVAWSTLSDPVSAVSAVVTEATGIDGEASISDAVSSISATGWPMVALVAGVALLVVAVLIALSSGRWPVAGSKYQATADAPPAAERTAVSDWDRLSSGDDPTGPPTSR